MAFLTAVKDKPMHAALGVVYLIAGCVMLNTGSPKAGGFLLGISAIIVIFGVLADDSEA